MSNIITQDMEDAVSSRSPSPTGVAKPPTPPRKKNKSDNEREPIHGVPKDIKRAKMRQMRKKCMYCVNTVNKTCVMVVALIMNVIMIFSLIGSN